MCYTPRLAKRNFNHISSKKKKNIKGTGIFICSIKKRVYLLEVLSSIHNSDQQTYHFVERMRVSLRNYIVLLILIEKLYSINLLD